jgi:hypothetical protein
MFRNPTLGRSVATVVFASASLAACAEHSPTAPVRAPVIASGSAQMARGKPTREAVPDSFYEFAVAGGQACSFPVTGKAVVNRFATTTFSADENGDVVQLATGHLVFRFTNVATGRSVDINISGPGKATFHPDGSMTQEAFGVWYWLFPGGANLPGDLSLFLSRGRLVVETTSTGERTITSQVCELEAICAMLH